SLSSDGTMLAAIRNVSILNLWAMDAHVGGVVRQLTSATAQENSIYDFVMGKDGSVVFRLDDAGHRFWRIGADGSAPVPLTTDGTLGGVFFPLPDRGVVFMRYEESLVPHIWRVGP